MIKKNILFAVTGILSATSSYAFIPSSAVTTMALPIYGIYTSADATCVSGFSATVPLSKTPQSINLAASPVIGSGPVSATIGCVIIVMGNNLSNGWAAGSYGGTSTNGGSDSVCNAGGSNTGQAICHGINPTWPAQVIADAAAIGLTIQTGTCAGSTSEVVPLVLSTHSLCTGQSDADASTSACAGGNQNNFALPTSAADASNGTKLVAPSAAGDLNFVVNPANTLGNNGGTCDNVKAPLFSFTAH